MGQARPHPPRSPSAERDVAGRLWRGRSRDDGYPLPRTYEADRWQRRCGQRSNSCFLAWNCTFWTDHPARNLLERGFSGLGARYWTSDFFDPEVFEVLVEIVAIYILVRCTANLARAIERRGDVLDYV